MSSLPCPAPIADRYAQSASLAAPLASSTAQPAPAAPGLPDQVFLTAGIRAEDHVVVVGYRTLEHLIGLNRLHCRSVVAIRPDRPLPALATADTVWLTDATCEAPRLMPRLMGIIRAARLRTVVIEVAGAETAFRLPLLLDDLRFEGFVQVSSYDLGGRRLVVAARPDWLRRIV